MRHFLSFLYSSLALLPATTLASALPATSKSSSSDPLPLIIWHGLGDNYAADGLQDVAALAEITNPGTYVYVIRLDADPSSDRTATFFGNVTDQIAKVCDDISKEPILSTAPALNALGFSQGGQFLRAYVERCNRPPIRNLVTFGSQHNGIADFQACGATDFLCKGAMALLRTNTWSSFVQNRLVPAQYYRSVNQTDGKPTEQYLEHSNFLADVNNERAIKNKTYADNLSSLEKFVMFMFQNDTVVLPKETSWFAEVNRTSEEVTPLRNRTLYEDDWIGLKKLDRRGGLVFKTAPGGHMELGEKMLKETFKEYFAPPKKAKLVLQDGVSWDL